MDGERLGPLSYDVSAPEGETSAQRAIVVGALVIVGLMTVAMIGGWFVLGVFASRSAVVNGAPVLIVGAAVGAALLVSRGSLRRTRRTALLTVVALALVSAFFTNKMLGNVKPALPQIRQTIDSLELPPGFELLEEETYGDRLCRRGCPRIERLYSAPTNDPDPVSTLILAMFRQGWEPNTRDIDPALVTVALRGELTAHLSPQQGGGAVEMRVTRR